MQQVMACISYSSLTSTSSPSCPSSSMAAWWTNDLPIISLVADIEFLPGSCLSLGLFPQHLVLPGEILFEIEAAGQVGGWE